MDRNYTFSVDIPICLHNDLKIYCVKHNIRIKYLIRDMLIKFLKEEENNDRITTNISKDS